MGKAGLFCAAAILLISCSAVLADLSAFSDYTAVSEIGVSGLQSSYSADTKTWTALPDYMFTLGPERVTYPHGVGQVPSPGGTIGKVFDEGVMGVKSQGGDLMIQVAGGLNPLTGYYHNGWKTWYGQGDVFVTVEDTTGISHFALLNSWARDGAGNPLTLDGGHFDAAQEFHTGLDSDTGATIGSNLEGHLVSLSSTDDVVMAGGTGSYDPGYSVGGLPEGLDYRIYAQGGTDTGDAGLAHSEEAAYGQTWYIQTWTVPTNWLSSDPVFNIGLHNAPSCANDQIGMVTVVPAPGAFVLALAGLGSVGLIGKKKTRSSRERSARS